MNEQDKLTLEKVGAVVIAIALLVGGGCLLIEFTSLNEKFVTGMVTYSGFGVCVLAWRWPRTFTGPIRKALGVK